MNATKVADGDNFTYNEEAEILQQVMDEEIAYENPEELVSRIKDARKAMEKAAKELEFIEAAKLRDYITKLEKQLKDGKH